MSRRPTVGVLAMNLFHAVSNRPAYRNRWLESAIWLQLMTQESPGFDTLCTLSTFKRALSKMYTCMNRFAVGENESGVFSVKFHGFCPLNPESRRNLLFIYVCNPKTYIDAPAPSLSQFLEKNSQQVNFSLQSRLRIPSTQQSTTMIEGIPENNVIDINEERKRQRLNTLQDYWQSTEANSLFCPGQDNTKDCLQTRIKCLERAVGTCDGYRDIIDIDSNASNNGIFGIRSKAMFLCCAYKVALEEMPGKSWRGCAEIAIQKCNFIGNIATTSPAMIEQWNRVYRKKGSFPHPNKDGKTSAGTSTLEGHDVYDV